MEALSPLQAMRGSILHRHSSKGAFSTARRGYFKSPLPTPLFLPAEGGLTLRIRRCSTPEPAHRELYQTLGIGSEVVPPRKTWSRPEEGSK
jgi:hypothetical protein